MKWKFTQPSKSLKILWTFFSNHIVIHDLQQSICHLKRRQKTMALDRSLDKENILINVKRLHKTVSEFLVCMGLDEIECYRQGYTGKVVIPTRHGIPSLDSGSRTRGRTQNPYDLYIAPRTRNPLTGTRDLRS